MLYKGVGDLCLRHIDQFSLLKARLWRIMNRLISILILLTIFISASRSIAQQKMEIPEGMAQYFMIFLKPGPNRNQSPEEAEKLQTAHLSHFRNSVIAGKLVCVGPILTEGEIVGVSIYKTDTSEEAMQLAEGDPAVKAGRVVLEMHPWLGPEGLGKGYPERAKEKLLDQFEFDHFQLGLLYRGDQWTPEKTEATQKIQEGHMANINRLADEGKLIAAGPFTDNGPLRGIFVFTTKTIEEAKLLADTDPAVQAGRLKVVLHTWMVAKDVIPPVQK
jgi:uncharacterized protein YciI